MNAHTLACTQYAVIADLLRYPQANYRTLLEDCRAQMRRSCMAAAGELDRFGGWLKGQSDDEVEEAFTRTFDLNPLVSPIAGIHLFGEDSYKRGELMARLHERYQFLGIDPKTELPDHIGLLLCYLDAADTEERVEIDRFLLRKPLKVMLSRLEQKANPYGAVISALLIALESEFGKEEKHA